MKAETTTSARQDSTRNGGRTYAPLARGRPASRRIPSPPECLPRVLPGRSAVDGMDEAGRAEMRRDALLARTMADYSRIATETAAAMSASHGLAELDAQAITQLALQMKSGTATYLAGVEIYSRPTPSQQKKQIARLIDAVGEIEKLDADASYRPVRFRLIASAHDQGEDFDIGGLLDGAATLKRLLGKIDGEEVQKKKREETLETHWLGRSLPKMFEATYPGSPFGGTNNLTNERTGPGYTFVRLSAETIGMESRPTGDAIYEARRKARTEAATG